MNWKHIHLIFQREMTDQLRDRRTLFTITVLPLLLYPLLGMLMMQIAQFNRENVSSVLVIGAENWPPDFPLLTDAGTLVDRSQGDDLQRLLAFKTAPWPTSSESYESIEKRAREIVSNDQADAVLLVSPQFRTNLASRSLTVEGGNGNGAGDGSDERQADEPNVAPKSASKVDASISLTGLQMIANLARDDSQIARNRLDSALGAWQKDWVSSQLQSVGINPRINEPLRFAETDTAPTTVRHAMLWSKVLPFVMLVWALTGAFYPAIDLCAGEKERGTLETLLSSPARRCEIVWGKLFTIAMFSIGSAVLNLLSMHITAGIIVKKLASGGAPGLMERLGPMPIHALGWLLLLLIPMAAFFSALALAVAALARSTKEGQYYLMPLLLITIPLVALPMLPSLELNLGTSLVPVSGAIFLVRSLIEGRYAEAVMYLPVVFMVTLVCCWLSIRWAIRQFESESVMFRESDRWNLKAWVHHLWRDRGDTASPAEALLCGAVILVGIFFAQLVSGTSVTNWVSIFKSVLVIQIGLILTPCLLMAILLTRSTRRALRVHRVQMSHVAAAVLLGVTMHPTYLALGAGIKQLYEISPATAAVLQEFEALVLSQPLPYIILLLALLPAICEELAFRGFIFGGLLRHQGALRAIVVSALFFGFTHPLLHQSIAATLMGFVLGVIAWRTGGVLCTMIVHFVNNALSLTLAWCSSRELTIPRPLSWALSEDSGAWGYQPQWITISVVLSIALFFILFNRSLQTQKSVQVEMA